MPEYSYIGKNVIRPDAIPKVTGEALFTADLNLPKMLVGKVLRSPHPHARIVSIDTSNALRLPGVKAIVTGADTPGEKWGVFPYTRDQRMIQTDRVRYVGDEVAGVAAVDEDTALEALDLIKVEYELLPAVFDPLDAMAEGAPVIHQEYPGNVHIHVSIDVGDVDAAFASAHLIREDTYRAVEDSYFMAEPYAVTASCDLAGNLEVWCPNAGPHMKSKPLANALRMPLSKIKVRKVCIGGAFGGRSEICPADFIASLLSIKTRRPVKIVYTREENSTATRMGHAMITTHKIGVDKNGVVQARQVTSYLDGGAYTSTGPIAVSVPFLCMEQAYRHPNVRFNGYRVYTNKPIRGMIRIHGRAFACGLEEQLDTVAAELGLDPVEIRLRNCRRPNEYPPTNSFIGSCGMVECIEKAAESSGFKEKFGKLPPYRGIGLGINSVQTGFPLGIRGGSQAFIKFNEDGGATIVSGVVDNGQGNDTMLIQIAAEELGLPMEEISLLSADTELTPNDPGSYSMVSTFAGGNAVRLAAIDAKKQLFEIAADKLEANPADLVARNNKIYVKGSPDISLPLAKVVRLALIQNKPIMGRGHFAPEVDHRREWVSNPSGQLSQAFSFGATVVEVEVDPETGVVTTLSATAAQDCGYALNPRLVEVQFESSVAMGGTGGMLTEGCRWHHGHLLNPTQLDYLVPVAADMPRVKNIIVQSLDPVGPYGAKEAGMSIAMSAAQAYMGAICNATGIRFKEFPITPDKIIAALEEKQNSLKKSDRSQDEGGKD
ncbi:MAG: molybdopterin-dependent oxidoreductase [Deltaproteobacteria bacterium]|nr:molybdopterin-dependent oxidoreductase [Deltaproteobacteria bacterium]